MGGYLHERIGISTAEVYERVRKFVITVCFCGCEKVEVTFWFEIYSYLKKNAFTADCEKKSFKLGMLEGYHYFVNRGYTKRVHFLSKLVHKRG